MRDVLGRLRYHARTTTNLAAAVHDLVDFWRGIRPQTKFSSVIAPGLGSLSEPARAVLFAWRRALFAWRRKVFRMR